MHKAEGKSPMSPHTSTRVRSKIERSLPLFQINKRLKASQGVESLKVIQKITTPKEDSLIVVKKNCPWLGKNVQDQNVEVSQDTSPTSPAINPNIACQEPMRMTFLSKRHCVHTNTSCSQGKPNHFVSLSQQKHSRIEFPLNCLKLKSFEPLSSDAIV